MSKRSYNPASLTEQQKMDRRLAQRAAGIWGDLRDSVGSLDSEKFCGLIATELQSVIDHELEAIQADAARLRESLDADKKRFADRVEAIRAELRLAKDKINKLNGKVRALTKFKQSVLDNGLSPRNSKNAKSS